MGELTDAMRILGTKKVLGILRYSTGKYGLVGSIPMELTKTRDGRFPGRKSKVWESEQEAIGALLELGITKFQLADCTWYNGKEKRT